MKRQRRRYSRKPDKSTPPNLYPQAGPPADIDEGMKALQWACLSNQQSVSIDRHGIANRKRLNTLHRLCTGAAGQIQTWLQKRRRRFRVALITTTYSQVEGWRPDHIKQLMAHYRNWAWRRGFKLRGIWVMELQQRGAPHYHILLWLPRGLTPPKPDKQGWWRHGSTNCVWARKPVSYLAKYTSKIKSKGGAMPKGARIYATFGCPVHLGWWRCPDWLRQLTKAGHKVQRSQGGWWVDWSRGWAWRSPWTLDYFTEHKIHISWRGWRPGDIQPAYCLELQWRIAA